MRIDLNAGLPLEHASSSKAQNSRLVSRDNGEAAAAASNVSDKSTVRELASIALNAPEIRMPKVEALRASISSGQYRVGAGEIAASLLEELRTR